MCFNRENNSCCCAITIISALLGALGIAGIYYSGLLGGILPIVYITLILSILGLLYEIIIAICGCHNNCSHSNNCLISIYVGGIVSAAFALSITFVSATFSLIFIVFAVAFFMILLLINLVYFIINLLSIN